MSSGPSVSWRHPAFSGASRFSAVVKSTSTAGSAFSWIVSDAEVCRMNSATAPSRARASVTNFVTSAVRSVKPAPDVCTVSSEEAMEVAVTTEGVERERDLGEVIKPQFIARSSILRRREAPSRRMCLGLGTITKLMVRDARRCAPHHEAYCQILPLTSRCTRLAISIRRRQACSRNDIMRSMSRSLGSGISILRSPSATFGSLFFSESDFGSVSSILPAPWARARRGPP